MPCTECVTHGRECVTDELSDKRRKASAKRTQEELIDLRGFLDQILTVMRISDPAALQHFVQTVRAGADMNEIRDTVQRILHAHTHNQSSEPTLRPSPQNLHVGIDPNMVDPSMRNFFNPNPQ
ncbi:hypothetical protein VI817_004751 [Penicillium citrinum]|nr:hypothetical protein VI817_004751 [Penicillium citrinum]